MKIVILTQYFPPEVGAPQNRLFELAVRFKAYGAQITILTAMPNYPNMIIQAGYSKKLWCFEKMHGLEILRSWIYVKKSNSIYLRLLNYFSFVFSSFLLGLIKLNKHDYLICESPPLFLGISAFLLAKIKNSKLVFNVADLWPASAEKLNIISNKFLLSLTSKLELFLYKHSFIISGQSQGIVKNIAQRTKRNVYWLKNGADISLFSQEKITDIPHYNFPYHHNDFVVFYGGLLGYAQAMEIVLLAAEKLKDYPEIKFLLLGNGPEKVKLLILANQLKLQNILFWETKPRSELVFIISKINAVIIHLRKIELFTGIIPSKIFESLAMEKPILLGVAGEAKELFIEEGNCGLFFEPENADDLTDKILKLYRDRELCKSLGLNGRKYVVEHFNRNIIAKDFYDFLSDNLKNNTGNI